VTRRFQHPGAIYLVHIRGTGPCAIFLDDEDRERWLWTLGVTVDRCGLDLLAWCALTTHYHLLVRTPKGNIAHALHRQNSVYALGFNKRHERSGHLFGKRYDAWVIQSERHLLNEARYIALNPVEAGLVDHPARYRWSSYRATISDGRTWPANAAWELPHKYGGGIEAYRQFVEAGLPPLAADDAPVLLTASDAVSSHHQTLLGDAITKA
jgi:REP element-mobilizing transposase RayT